MQANPLLQAPGANKRILYMTDKFGVSSGYSAAFTRMLAKSAIRRQQVITASIYTLISNPLVRKGNEKTWRYNPEKLDEITVAFNQKISAIKPDIIVVSDPALLGVLTDGDFRASTLDKLRGGVYYVGGIPCVVTYPITAINTHVDETLEKDNDGDEIKYQAYKVKRGAWILQRDWDKVGRIIHGFAFRPPSMVYTVCRSVDNVLAAEKWLESCKLISTDIETGCFPAQITCIGFAGVNSQGIIRAWVVPFTDQSKDGNLFWEDETDHGIAWETCHRILNNRVRKTAHNGFYDVSYFTKYRLGINNYIWDSMYLWYSLYMELPKTLDFVSSILLDNHQYWKDDIKGVEDETVDQRQGMESYWRYNAIDCYTTLLNTMRLLQLMETNPSMRSNYVDTFSRVCSGFNMSMRGIKADLNRRDQIRLELEESRDKAVAVFRQIVDDPEFNINSPDQKCQLFYDVLGARPRNDKGRYVTKGGKGRSAGKIPLKMIATEHPLFNYIVRHLEAAMEPDKQISNVCNIKLQTPRFRTAYNAVGTTSTRYSSKKSNFWDGTNAQNIREAYRDWLVADEGCILFDADYSQSDDVVIAYESNDVNKIKLVESGLDGHAVHAELFFKVPYDEVVKGKKEGAEWIVHPITGVRQLSKRVVHGTNFIMAAMTLYFTMGRAAVVMAARLLGYNNPEKMSQDELVNVCAKLMLAYRRRYPRLTAKEWYRDLVRKLRDDGKLVNAFGVVRRFHGDPQDNGTIREAAGFIGQSGTAGNMNRTQREIDLGIIPATFRDGPNPCAKEKPLHMTLDSHGFEFLLQTHDSFTTQLHLRHPKWKEAAHNLLHVMQRPIIINGHVVKIRTDSKVGFACGKGMQAWDGKDPYDLDRIALTNQTMKEMTHGK